MKIKSFDMIAARKAAAKAERKKEKAAQLKTWAENAAKRKKIESVVDDLNFEIDCGLVAEKRAEAEKEKTENENAQA
jgi:hypothetical protein